MEDLLRTKLGALTVIFILALVSGMLPIKLRSALFNNSRIPEKYTLITLSASLCCGAGVLMATVFLHILKETREGFEEAVNQGAMNETEYSLAELLMCCGFFLIYFLEEIVHYFVYKKCEKEEDEEEFCQFRRVSSVQLSTRVSRRRFKEDSVHNRNLPVCKESQNDPSHADLHEHLKVTVKLPTHNNDTSAVPRTKTTSCVTKKIQERTTEESLVRSFLVIIALSLHGAFEGLSVGLENSTNNVWLLCMALSAHKVFIAISIGMEMLEEGVNRTVYVIHMLVFSLASPIGGTLGITLTESLNNNDAGTIIITVLKGVSGGTILYVTFCEVLERERTKTSGRFIRLFALIVGFSIVAGLQSASVEHHHDSLESNTTQELLVDHDH